MSGQGAGGADQSGRRTPPSVKRYIASVDRAVGGRPPKNCSDEEWDKYFDKFMIENDRRGAENNAKSVCIIHISFPLSKIISACLGVNHSRDMH